MTRLLIFLLLLVSLVAQAQSDFDQKILDAFEEYKKAYMEVDRAKLLKMAHPNIVEMGGGSEFYIQELTDNYNMYASSGLTLLDIEANQSSKVLEEKGICQAMLPYVRTLAKGKEKLIEKNFFLVTSHDDGSTWFFTDLIKFGVEDIKLFIPEYNKRLSIYLESNHK